MKSIIKMISHLYMYLQHNVGEKKTKVVSIGKKVKYNTSNLSFKSLSTPVSMLKLNTEPNKMCFILLVKLTFVKCRII